jgi:hypothetical protein
VALEAVRGKRTVSELAAEYGAQPSAVVYFNATQTD